MFRRALSAQPYEDAEALTPGATAAVARRAMPTR